MEKYLKILLKLAQKAYDNGDVPVSAIVIYNGKIIGKGYNTRYKNSSVIGHAEINAIIQAEKKIGDFRLNGCILISTLKPCDMCLSVIMASRIDKVYYFVNHEHNYSLQNVNINKIEFSDCEYLDGYIKLMKSFFENLR